jgi:hypothetical protein
MWKKIMSRKMNRPHGLAPSRWLILIGHLLKWLGKCVLIAWLRDLLSSWGE